MAKRPTIAAAVTDGLPDNWGQVQWNPPMHRAASGAYVGDSNLDGSLDDGSDGYFSQRSRILGPGDDESRRAKKGVLFQYRAFDGDFTYQADAGGNYTAGNGVDPNIRYGFRFHYNPSTIDFGLPTNTEGINPALIISSSTSAKPITGSGGQISMTLFLNRIEDMALFSKPPANSPEQEQYARDLANWKNRYRTAKTQKEKNYWRQNQPVEPSVGRDALVIPDARTLDYFYGKPDGKSLSADDVRGIYNRGTGWDLEFLFRTVLGKPWPTLLRDDTADVGMSFGLPLILDLSAGTQPFRQRHGNRYLGRLEGISYTHLSFNNRMVPMWTQVSLTFTRYPDVQSSAVVEVSGTYTAPYDPTQVKSSNYSSTYLPVLGAPYLNRTASAPAVPR